MIIANYNACRYAMQRRAIPAEKHPLPLRITVATKKVPRSIRLKGKRKGLSSLRNKPFLDVVRPTRFERATSTFGG
jgi:hypothetical protein